MGFFDDFGKKISSASQDAIAKTKDIADIAKLNSNISDEERKINTAYSEIGKMYFELHSDDYEECFDSFFQAVKESKEKIAVCEQQISDIKGVIKCSNCGAEVPKGAAFCATCGSPVVQEIPANEIQEHIEKKCPSCGELIGEGATFCAKCGTKVEES